MIDWLRSNVEWVFSGIGVAALGFIGRFFFRRKNAEIPASTPGVNITNLNYVNSPSRVDKGQLPFHSQEKKSRIRILFIDDDTRFQVVGIIKGQGWMYTKIVRDVRAIEAPEIQEADILFVDIQGVGKALQFSNQGLGLALAIKNKYPQKKVVIYSAQTSGERFDEALRRADDFLAKNADPYEFITVVERLAEEL